MNNKEKQLQLISDDLILDINNQPYYENFDTSTYGNTLEPGSMPAPYFYEWVVNNTTSKISSNEPILAIEVGSFLGYSAIGFAQKLKKHNPQSKLICVDTWLGSPEHFHMLKNKGDNRLGWVNGYPTMYHKFISNVIIHDVQDIIIPLPFPSTIGFKIINNIFNKHNIQADFAYIDGSHEEMEVYMDLFYYYQLVGSGGVVCGDDWAWESVRNDVTKFCMDNSLENPTVLSNNVHWIITK
jgi:hypothetical protein